MLDRSHCRWPKDGLPLAVDEVEWLEGEVAMVVLVAGVGPWSPMTVLE